MKILSDKQSLKNFRQNLIGTVGVVPTMGALHEGHLFLMQQALQACDHVIATIFVNPTQFGPNEDYDAYPRLFEEDCQKLQSVGVQAVYIPTVEDMYGQAVNHQNHKDLFQTKVSVSGIPDQLCGAARAGHFDGVATIVTKLLMRTRPDKAFFGEKDFQQLAVIRQFVRDLDYDIDIVGVPIVRDHNGLALSSRNRYLTTDQYQIAIQMNKILTIAADQLQANKNVDVVCQDAQDALLGAGFEKVDYVAVRRADHLTSVQQKEGQELRILAAAWLGKARLIDNRAA